MYFAEVRPEEFFSNFSFPIKEFYFIRDESTRQSRNGIDPGIKETVRHFLNSYFTRNPDSIIFCEYSDMNGSNRARSRLFINWIDMPISKFKFESTSINGICVSLIIPINSIHYQKAVELFEDLKNLPD